MKREDFEEIFMVLITFRTSTFLHLRRNRCRPHPHRHHHRLSISPKIQQQKSMQNSIETQ